MSRRLKRKVEVIESSMEPEVPTSYFWKDSPEHLKEAERKGLIDNNTVIISWREDDS